MLTLACVLLFRAIVIERISGLSKCAVREKIYMFILYFSPYENFEGFANESKPKKKTYSAVERGSTQTYTHTHIHTQFGFTFFLYLPHKRNNSLSRVCVCMFVGNDEIKSLPSLDSKTNNKNRSISFLRLNGLTVLLYCKLDIKPHLDHVDCSEYEFAQSNRVVRSFAGKLPCGHCPYI